MVNNNEPKINKIRKNTLKFSMVKIQNDLRPTAKLLSKIFHNFIIERSLNIFEITLFRAKTIVFASIITFVLTLAFYSLSYRNGFNYNYATPLYILTISYLLGLIVEFLYKALKILLTR